MVLMNKKHQLLQRNQPLLKIFLSKKMLWKKKLQLENQPHHLLKKHQWLKKDVAQETKTDKDAALKALIKEKAAAKKPAAKSKTSTPSGKTTVTVKSVTSAKADIEVPKENIKTSTNKDCQKSS